MSTSPNWAWCWMSADWNTSATTMISGLANNFISFNGDRTFINYFFILPSPSRQEGRRLQIGSVTNAGRECVFGIAAAAAGVFRVTSELRGTPLAVPRRNKQKCSSSRRCQIKSIPPDYSSQLQKLLPVTAMLREKKSAKKNTPTLFFLV